MATPLAPLARANTVSFVEHFAATVMALNVSRPQRLALFFKSPVQFASHVRNASIVAMSGSIMPEPWSCLQHGRFGDRLHSTAVSFGNGSVVMIASTASCCCSGRARPRLW